jgi:hypothetical protein
MYCPQCATESSPGLQYCRSCGANLKVIGKAVALSEAIARSDRGPLPKIKEMVKNLKIEHVTEEVSRALDRMNKEIVRTTPEGKSGRPGPFLFPPHLSGWLRKEKKTPEERREQHVVKGTISLFTGIGLTIFLYYFSAALVLKLPPDWIARIPFELEPLVRVLWLLGLIPVLSGAGHIVAGLLIRPGPPRSIEAPPLIQPTIPRTTSPQDLPASITEHTTNLLDPTGLDAPLRSDAEKAS